MMRVMAADPSIGTTIQKRRHVLGWTQEQLAERVGVNRSTITNWERGKHFPQRYLGRVEDVLGIRLDRPPDPPVIPPALQRQLDKLTEDERAYVIDLLTRRRGSALDDDAKEAQG